MEAERKERVYYLDALRGFSSLQVLLLHVFSAFIPALAFPSLQDTWAGRIHYSPLFFLYDGYSAVYIFFALSGYVLTLSFQKSHASVARLAGSRVVRLGLPVLAAGLFALCLKLWVGAPNIEAGQIIGSGWLAALWSPQSGVYFWLKDIVINGLLLGYQGFGIWPSNPAIFDNVALAYIAPLWTLSVELQGSLLILLHVIITRRSRTGAHLALAVCFLLLWRTHFVCFIVGYGLARMNFNFSKLRTWQVGLIPLALAGVFLCVAQEFTVFDVFRQMCDLPMGISLKCTPHSQKLFGAMLIFIWALNAPLLARMFSRQPFIWLGSISFSLYLIHWPIIFGIASVLLLSVTPVVGLQAAITISAGFSIAISLALATLFRRVDQWAVDLAREVKTPKKADQPVT